jgi:hypothetical protein
VAAQTFLFSTLTQRRHIFVLVRNYEWNSFLLTVHFSFLCANFGHRRDVTSRPLKMGLQALQQACPLHFSSRRQRLAYEGFFKKPPHFCCSKKKLLLQLNMQNLFEKFKQLEKKTPG